MNDESTELDNRAQLIEKQREAERTLLGQFAILDGELVTFELSAHIEDFDENTLAACLIQLMDTYMNRNPDISPVAMAGALQTAMANLMKG